MPYQQSSEPVRLTSASTTYFARIVPVAVTLLTGAVAVGAWLGPLGDGVDAVARWTALGIAVVGSAIAHRWFGRLRHVWLDSENLVVGGDPRRGVRVALRDVADIAETRWQKLKWVKVTLTHTTAVGDTIRFIPRGREAWLTPWVSSPVVKKLRERVEAAKGVGPGEGVGSLP